MGNQIKLTRYFYSPKERPDEVLTQQLRQGAATVAQLTAGNLKDHQRDALVCLVADVLAGLAEAPSSRFEQSFLVHCLKKGMLQIVAGEFHTFCYARGKFNRRAWDKRRAEHYLFTTGRMLFD